MMFFGISGNIQNNIVDYEIDSHKKHFIAFDKTAYIIIMIVLMIIASVLSFAGFYLIFNATMLYAILSVPLLLTLYNYFFKKYPVIGNVVVAFLTALAIFIPINYALGLANFSVIQISIFKLLLIAAFFMTWLREMVKDMEDYHIDKLYNFYTLPVIHLSLSKIIFYFLLIVFLSFIVFYKNLLPEITFYTLFSGLLLGFIYSSYLVFSNQFEKATKLLKGLMLFGFIVLIFNKLG
jgi:4-hydroxybenzoate polyprenyltransferase